MTIIPSAALPKTLIFWDKAQHVLAFATLSLFGSLAYPSKTKLIYASLFVYGISIEIVQKYGTRTHVGDVHDLLADTIGIFAGFVIYFAACKIRQHFGSK